MAEQSNGLQHLLIPTRGEVKPDQRPEWKPVRCAECGRLLCEISPGSVVKIRCKHCRVYVEKAA